MAGWLWLIPGVAGRRAYWQCGGLAHRRGRCAQTSPFITTGRGQGSLGHVPDSGTKVLHHRAEVVVLSPAWLLGSVHISLFGGKLGHGSRNTADHHVRLVRQSSIAKHNRTQTWSDIDCISGHNTCKYTTSCGTRTWQQLQRQTALQQTADSTAPRGCTDVAVSSLLPVLREEQAAQ